MDLCHLKNSKLELQYQKHKSRVVVRGDIVKDDSGSYAVFTEQGSVSQMTTAKVMDVIVRPLGYAGQVADAVSAETLVKMEGSSTLLKIQNSECPDISTEPQMAEITAQHGRSSRSSRKESCTIIL